MNSVYYSQTDSRWKNYPYPSQALPKATIGSGGCGVCTCAMIVSMLKEIVLPTTMADMFVRDGIRVNGGTSNKAYQYIADKYGLKTHRTEDYNELKECLQRGCIAAVGCGNGLFTNGGHIICIKGIEGNNLIIHDSYLYSNKFNVLGRNNRATIRGTEVVCSIDNFRNYANAGGFWIYEPTGIDTDPTQKEDTKEIYVVKRGDTLYGLAKKFGTTVNELVRINNISKPNLIYIGQQLKISGYAPAPTPVGRNTVGQTKKLKANCKIWSKPELNGTYYNYLKNTTVKILENVNAEVDKINVPATGRIAYINIAWYK